MPTVIQHDIETKTWALTNPSFVFAEGLMRNQIFMNVRPAKRLSKIRDLLSDSAQGLPGGYLGGGSAHRAGSLMRLDLENTSEHASGSPLCVAGRRI